MKAPKILVGTPAYNGQVHIDYVESLMSFQKAGIHMATYLLDKESLITRARNEILSQFLHAPGFTHLLFLDGDINLTGEDLLTMIGHNKDVMGAKVPLKGYGDDGGLLYNSGKELAQVGELSLVTRVGTAVLLLSRRAVVDLAAEAAQNGRVYRRYLPKGRYLKEGIRYDVFRVGTRFGEYLSEDFWVCYQLRELGYGIYIDPRVRAGHNGMHRFDARSAVDA